MTYSKVCYICGRDFTLAKNLHAHLRNVHRIEPFMEGKTIKCSEDNCSFSCFFMTQLRLHVKNVHKVEIMKETIKFNSWEEFLHWKTEEEKATSSSFVKPGGSFHMYDGTEKVIFRCHRSGRFRSISKGKRVLKSQGSSKLGSHCTAAMEAKREDSGACTVIYYKTHFGHVPNVGYLRLSRSDREAIAAKLAEGITMERILDDARGSLRPERMERIHIITRKDLNNIKRDFRINNVQQHKSDGNRLQEDNSMENEALEELDSNQHTPTTPLSTSPATSTSSNSNKSTADAPHGEGEHPVVGKTSEVLSVAGNKRNAHQTPDSFDTFGQHVAKKLRVLRPKQNVIAQRLINDVLFEADAESLNKNFKVVEVKTVINVQGQNLMEFFKTFQ